MGNRRSAGTPPYGCELREASRSEAEGNAARPIALQSPGPGWERVVRRIFFSRRTLPETPVSSKPSPDPHPEPRRLSRV